MKQKFSIIMALVMFFGVTSVIPESKAASIKIGDYVTFGKYYDAPILWRCVDIEDNGPLMLSDKILAIKAFDARGKHPNDFQDQRLYNGSNLWISSNIRSWLNSLASSNNIDWFCGNPPTADRVMNRWNEYAHEKGFLSDGNFTSEERSAIKQVNQKSLLNHCDRGMATSGNVDHTSESLLSDVMQNYDNAYAHIVTDKIFLLDVKQIYKVYQNMSLLGDNYYLAKRTQECIDNSDDSHFGSSTSQNHLYWLRSPYSDCEYPNLVRLVDLEGDVTLGSAESSYVGVRPAFFINLSSAIFKSGDGSEGNPYILDGNGNSNWTDSEPETPPIKVLLNGTELTFDQQPIMENGRTLVPLRAIFEAMGAEVGWDGDTQTVVAKRIDVSVSFRVGSNVLIRNNEHIELDVPAQLIDGRVLVPVRAVSEAFGANVDWDDKSKTVLLTYNFRDGIMNYAKGLFQANEQMGGARYLATFAEVDAELYKVLLAIDLETAKNKFTLDMISLSTKISIAAAKVVAGDYTSLTNALADTIDSVAKDVIKNKLFQEIKSNVPDTNTLIYNLGSTAYDNNSKAIMDLITAHGKFLSGDYTYDDAVAYIYLNYIHLINRETLSMSVKVLVDELPDGILDIISMSTSATVRGLFDTIIGDAFSGRDINGWMEVYTDLVTAYTEYAYGEAEALYSLIQKSGHPAIVAWIENVKSFESDLNARLYSFNGE